MKRWESLKAWSRALDRSFFQDGKGLLSKGAAIWFWAGMTALLLTLGVVFREWSLLPLIVLFGYGGLSTGKGVRRRRK